MLPFPSGRAGRVFVHFLVAGTLFAAGAGFAQQAKKASKKKSPLSASASPGGSASPVAGANSQVPLPIGHEAKGLTFPDIDLNGQTRGRFTAGTARRVDQDHMEFRDLDITTFTDDKQVDMKVRMSDSILDLNTHVLTSGQRTTIKRSDFEIVGDRARFDTAARHGTLTGNVKMVLTNAQKYTEAKPTP